MRTSKSVATGASSGTWTRYRYDGQMGVEDIEGTRVERSVVVKKVLELELDCLETFVNNSLPEAWCLRSDWKEEDEFNWECTISVVEDNRTLSVDWFGMKRGVLFLAEPLPMLVKNLIIQAGCDTLRLR